MNDYLDGYEDGRRAACAQLLLGIAVVLIPIVALLLYIYLP